MPLSRKLSIAVMFCLGCVCIMASTIRVTQINNGAKQPTPPWLALWGTRRGCHRRRHCQLARPLPHRQAVPAPHEEE